MSKLLTLMGLISALALAVCSCSGDKGTAPAPEPIPKTTVTDVDGNVYLTITVGNQVWMAENLRVTHYRNGDVIPNVVDNTAWRNLTSGAYCEFNNDLTTVDAYGRYYNWHAVHDSRNIAPVGWRVPTDEDWQTLVDYLGGLGSAGGKMKETGSVYWRSPNNDATNETGMSVRGAGHRNWDGQYIDEKASAWFWTSTEDNTTDAWYWELVYDAGGVARGNYLKLDGFTIRCIKGDAPTVTTGSISEITLTSALCGGDVTADGGSAVVTRGVCWGTDASPTVSGSKTIDGSGTGSYTSTLTDLTPGTKYYVRAYATNEIGVGYGSIDSFTTVSPQQIKSTFDISADGWTVSGGALYYRGSNGNPGGFVEFEDSEDQCGYFTAPSKFGGDLTAYSGGTLSFDLMNIYDNAGAMLGCYGDIIISSGSLSAECNVVPYNTYISDWTSFSIPMTDSAWGVTPAQWDSILTDVTSIIIYMDAQMDYVDRTGLDNFTITVPVKNAAALSEGRNK